MSKRRKPIRMQCPEVWNFKEPETIFKSHVVDPDDKSCFSKIRSFHYNHLVRVMSCLQNGVVNFMFSGLSRTSRHVKSTSKLDRHFEYRL